MKLEHTIYLFVGILCIGLFISFEYILNQYPSHTITHVNKKEEKVTDLTIQNNIRYYASEHHIILKIEDVTHPYQVVINHFQNQPLSPCDTQEKRDLLGNLLLRYYNYKDYQFQVCEQDFTTKKGYIQKPVQLVEGHLSKLCIGEEIYDYKVDSIMIHNEDLIEDNHQYELQGIEFKPYSSIFNSNSYYEGNHHYQDFEDPSQYDNFEEFLYDHPDLTEDDAFEIFEAYHK